jgi:hypothetical protein
MVDTGKRLFSYNGNRDDVETFVNCEEFPEICDKIRDKFKPKPKPKEPTQPTNPGGDTGGKDNGDNKDKKKKKKKKQSQSWGDVPSWMSEKVREIERLGLRGVSRKTPDGRWILVDNPREYVKKVFGI